MFWELLKVIIPINNIGKHAELKNNSFKSSNNKRLTLQTEERERQRERERERQRERERGRDRERGREEREGERGRGRETNSIDCNYRISCHCLIY